MFIILTDYPPTFVAFVYPNVHSEVSSRHLYIRLIISSQIYKRNDTIHCIPLCVGFGPECDYPRGIPTHSLPCRSCHTLQNPVCVLVCRRREDRLGQMDRNAFIINLPSHGSALVKVNEGTRRQTLTNSVKDVGTMFRRYFDG